jgi:penicillin-binding protein 2
MDEVFDFQFQDKEEIFSSSNKKPFWAIGVLAILFLGLLIRAFYLQVLKTSYYQDLASGNKLRKIYIAPSRGLILDRHGKRLAYNIPSFNLVVVAIDLPASIDERKKIYEIFKKELNIDVSKEIEKAYELKIQDELIFPLDIKETEALIFKEKYASAKGFSIEEREKRKYESNISHILGYLGKINEDEWEEYKKNNYLLFEWVGKSGLEKEYESELRGIPGAKEVEVDALGKIKKSLARIEPKSGNNLKLTIDYELQKKAKEALIKKLEEKNLKKGAVVILDPRNGEVLSLVSLPDYDNNLFLNPSSDLEKILSSEEQPLFDRAISGNYPSGSVIKPVIASAGLEEKIIDSLTTFECRGELEVKNQYNPSIVYKFKDNAIHGLTNVYKAIAKSCNVFFYILGGGYGNIRGLGVERIVKYLNIFGIGKKTGIDLPEEAEGFVPTPEWKEKVKKEVWYLGDTYHLSIGQGDLLVTPLQVASYTMAIANKGFLYKPHLVSEILDNSFKVKKKIKEEYEKLPISERNLEIVREAMRQAVEWGTANQLKTLKVSSAGKTGTAEDPQGKEPYGWFTAFAPYENPEIVVTVMIEHGGEGYYSAEPVAKEILEFWQNKR